MTLLLDTHVVLWAWFADPQLSKTAADLITDPRNHKLVSRATPWEVAIKVSTGKLRIGAPLAGFFAKNMAATNFDWLHMSDEHFAAVAGLPFHHRDPFDRLIIAQAVTDGIPVVSADGQFDAYPVTRLW